MKKPLPNSAVVSSSALISLPGIFGSTGKNRFLMMGVINANTVKSYHSIALPATAATMALLFVVRITDCLFRLNWSHIGGVLPPPCGERLGRWTTRRTVFWEPNIDPSPQGGGRTSTASG